MRKALVSKCALLFVACPVQAAAAPAPAPSSDIEAPELPVSEPSMPAQQPLKSEPSVLSTPRHAVVTQVGEGSLELGMGH